MAQPKSMKTLEVCRVQPNSGASKSVPLTFFDLLWLRFPPVERLFFYEISNQNKLFFFNSILPNLKHSLSLTLQHFLPLAGNLIWPQDSPKPIIQYVEGDAVSLTVAESYADFCHLSGYHVREAIESHHLVPVLPRSHALTPVIALQVTVFPNYGFCIGISSPHVVLDGKSSTMFLKSWAHICKFGGDQDLPLPLELTPLIERTMIKDPGGVGTAYINRWLDQDGPNNRSLMLWELKTRPDAIRGTFELSRADHEKLRGSVLARLAEKNKEKSQFRVSTITLTCAYAWICLVKAEGLKNSKVSIGLGGDCRARLVPPLPETYFGNCIGGIEVDLEANELLGEDGLTIAVEAITKAITSFDEEALAGAEDWISNVFSPKTTRFVGVAGSPRFELYKRTDFGWGRPKKVDMVSNDRTGSICITDSRNGDGGVEIGLVLKKHEMEAFSSLFAKGLDAL